MPRGSRSRSGIALVILGLFLIIIWAISDLSASDSVLAAKWNTLFRSQAQGEHLRDDVVDRLKSRR